MQSSRVFAGIALIAVAAMFWPRLPLRAQTSTAGTEYLTIRWSGRENTHVIRPGGKVEFIGSELRKLTRPDRADERSFYLNAAMNGLVKEGWEFAGMNPDEIVMRRALGH